jgi:hypothetical protein
MLEWSPEDFAAAKEQEARRAARRPVSIRAQLRPPGSDRLTVDVTDLSETGFQIRTVYRLQPGSTVWLAIPSLAALEAVVAWNREGHYGCRFFRPLYPAVFDHIVALAGRA